MTLILLTFRRFGLLLAILVILSPACVDTSIPTSVAIEHEKRITFFLIDNSLSYNNPDDLGSQRVMTSVKREIIERMRQAQPGDHFIVRTIQSESNQLSAMIATLNLAKENLHFQKPRPSNPIELKVWEGERRDFEATLAAKITPVIEASIEEFTAGANDIFTRPSNQTDFVGALLTCQRFFEKLDYQKKRLVIYSDMIEDAALEDDSQLDLRGVEVEARFVTKPASEGAKNTHQYFKSMEAYWGNKLNADKFELYEVQNSFLN